MAIAGPDVPYAIAKLSSYVVTFLNSFEDFRTMLHFTKRAARANSRSYSVHLSLAVVCAVLLQSPTVCWASAIGTIIPAYFYPGTGGPGGVGDGWAAMATAATEIPVTAIFNPNSGPATGLADPNYVNAITNLETAGGHVVAYVYTGDGAVPLATVEGQISTYISQYGPLIGGFFIDGMSLAPSTLSYYQNLDQYVKGLSSSYAVVGNTGNPRLHGVSPSDYLSTADVFDIFEGPADPGSSGFSDYPYGENWFESYPRSRFSNIVYNVPASALLDDINKGLQLNAGAIYVTDRTGSNPYDQLPSYWDQEVYDLGHIATVPEPGTLSALALGAIITLCGRAQKHTQCQRVISSSI